MIKKIAIDLDDTLNSCTMHILHSLGCDVGPEDYYAYPVSVGYDMVGAWSVLTNRPRVPVNVFWEWISRRIWETMPKCHSFWLLEEAASMVGEENVLIATSPTKSADCLFAKYQWMDQHLPEWCKRQYAITPRKHWLAQPGVLLIDDCDTNCKKFEQLGGESILVPRPWNSLFIRGGSMQQADDHLRNQLERLQCRL